MIISKSLIKRVKEIAIKNPIKDPVDALKQAIEEENALIIELKEGNTRRAIKARKIFLHNVYSLILLKHNLADKGDNND